LILYSRYDIDGAERECRTAIKCDPQTANVHTLLDTILASKRNTSMAQGASQEHKPVTAAANKLIGTRIHAGAGAGAGAGAADPSPSTKKKSARKPCGSCKLVGGTLKCSRCKSTYYCNRDCQKAHWKHGGHKHECQPLVNTVKMAPDAAVLVQMEGMSLGSDEVAAKEGGDEHECAICLDPVNEASRR
jgi:hypothetical protein